MQPDKSPVKRIKACFNIIIVTALLAAGVPARNLSSRALASITPAEIKATSSLEDPAVNLVKSAAAQGEFVGPALDCDGDGQNNETRIDFDGDGTGDECVEKPEEIPEPPFQQSYTPTSESFYGQLPAVGWNASYQCGDDLYEVTLRRPSEDKLEYSSEGLTLSTPIVYDDLDPNLNQPLIIQDPQDGLRYSFSQERDGEFYEYAIADYSGSVGLYVYQTGEQIVAAPCAPITGAIAEAPTVSLAKALEAK